MRSPLGDQNGPALIGGSLVKRASVRRLRSRTHRSPPMAELRQNTTDFSSGEIAGSQTGPGAPTGPRDLPDRSNQTARRRGGKLWKILCPWRPEDGRSAFIVRFSSGAQEPGGDVNKIRAAGDSVVGCAAE